MNLISIYLTSCNKTKSGINPTVFLVTVCYDHSFYNNNYSWMGLILLLYCSKKKKKKKKRKTLILYHNIGINEIKLRVGLILLCLSSSIISKL